MRLSGLDLGILIAYLLGMVGFGLWVGRRRQSAAEFMLGGRDFPWWVILASIVATETSTVTFLSVPGLAWSSDWTFLQLPIGYVLGRLLVTAVLLPRYFTGNLFTAYEVLQTRFGGSVKQLASGLFVVTRTLGDGMRLFLSALVLQIVAGIDLGTAVACLGVATIVYTFSGGMRAVLWTDLLQLLIYMAGAAIAMWVLLDRIDGGWNAVVEQATVGARDKLRVFDTEWRFDKAHVLWAGVVGGAVLTIGTHGVDQMLVQRYLCARSRAQAGVALALSGPVVLLQFTLFLAIGTALFVFYQQHPPAIAFDPVGDRDRVLARFVVDHLPSGVRGVVLGAVFAAAMSTLSSSLNSAATALVNDILMPARSDDDDRRRLRAVKLLTVGFGVAQIAVGIGSQGLRMGVISSVLAVQGWTTGIILGVFALGIFTRRVGHRAATIGMVGGVAVMVWVWRGTSLAWPWYALVGSTATFAIGMVAQWTGRKK
ncbi:MAG: sodium/solute symporter [Planctomycetes bacterium]|nr:sodium/solute symporter [Planctomycetota bacterium]